MGLHISKVYTFFQCRKPMNHSQIDLEIKDKGEVLVQITPPITPLITTVSLQQTENGEILPFSSCCTAAEIKTKSVNESPVQPPMHPSSPSKWKDHIYIPENSYWDLVPTFKFPNMPFTLKGYSVSACNTSFWIPELELFLDAGVPHRKIIKYQFITHAHADHYKCLRDGLFEVSPKVKPTIVVPAPMKEAIKNDIFSGIALSKNNPNTNINNKYTLIGAKAGESFQIQVKNMTWKVEVIKCNHSVPTSGYGFVEIRNKLKEEYKSLSQEEINKLRKDNVQLTEEKEYPLFCFLGDTDHKVFEDNRLEKYSVIITECTFFERESEKIPSKKNKNISEMQQDAAKKKHMYWDNLKTIVKQRPQTLFIITHFSARYTQKQIHEFFSEQKIGNIHIWA